MVVEGGRVAIVMVVAFCHPCVRKLEALSGWCTCVDLAQLHPIT